MNKNQFRILVLFSFLVGILSIIFGSLADDQLPKILHDYVESTYEEKPSFFILSMFAVAIATLTANIGLFFFANWARIVFTVGVIFCSIGMLWFGPTVQSAIERTFGEIVLISDGAIIALLYFSDVKYFYEKKMHNKAASHGPQGPAALPASEPWRYMTLNK